MQLDRQAIGRDRHRAAGIGAIDLRAEALECFEC